MLPFGLADEIGRNSLLLSQQMHSAMLSECNLNSYIVGEDDCRSEF